MSVPGRETSTDLAHTTLAEDKLYEPPKRSIATTCQRAPNYTTLPKGQAFKIGFFFFFFF